jgi:hypothetical protein
MGKPDPVEWAKAHTPTPSQEAAASRAVEAARFDAKRENRIAKELRNQIAEVEKALGIALELSRQLPSVPVKGRPSLGKRQACPVVLASDWHVEERVLASHVNGLNAYSPEIAQKRAEAFVEGVLWLLDTHRAGTVIDEMVLALLGDFITGWIHEEMMSGNAMTPLEAVLFVQERLYVVIVTILERGKLKRIRIPCTRGNHGRSTKKTYINCAARTSYEWLMYRTLAAMFKDDPRVVFTIEDGYHTYIDIYDKVARFSHGDAVSYQGGVGGLHIPLAKHVARSNRARRADVDFLGHFHTFSWSGSAIVNGSLIGWNDYAGWIGASPEPAQQAFVLIRPERGVSAVSPIFVT